MKTDFHMPSYAEIDAIERKAAATRAEAMRQGFVALGRGVTRLPARLSAAMRRARTA